MRKEYVTLEINMEERTITQIGDCTENFENVLSNVNMSFEEIVKEFEEFKTDNEIITYLQV